MSPSEVFRPTRESVDFATWAARVERDLKGRPAQSLAKEIASGVHARVLYDHLDGAKSLGDLGRRGTYCIEQEYAQPGPARAAQAIAEDLARGAGAAWIRLGENLQGADPVETADGVGIGLDRRPALRRLLRDLPLAEIPLYFECGAAALPVASMLGQVAEQHELAVGALKGGVLADPWAPLARRGRLAVSAEQALDDLALHVATLDSLAPRLRSLSVSVVSHHNAGADAVDEIGLCLATIVDYARALDARGVPVSQGLSRLVIRVAVGSDIVTEISKLRALRACLARLSTAFGAEVDAHIHARGSWRARAQIDPWVNLLRGTAESFAAVVGGADGGCTTALDAGHGSPSQLARRLALNTQILLTEESHLAHVIDPAAGSETIEALTDGLARAAWARMQAIEGGGGMLAALTRGDLQAQLQARAVARHDAVATQSQVLVGVNRFPPVEERATPTDAGIEPAAVRLGAPNDHAAVQARLVALAAVSRDAARTGPIEAAIGAAVEAGASVDAMVRARPETPEPLCVEPLVQRRDAAPYEGLRARVSTLSPAQRQLGLRTVGTLAQYKRQLDALSECLRTVGLRIEPACTDPAFVVLCGGEEALAQHGAEQLQELGDAKVVVTGSHGVFTGPCGDQVVFWDDQPDIFSALETLVDRLERGTP